jgi:hypothetical protein
MLDETNKIFEIALRDRFGCCLLKGFAFFRISSSASFHVGDNKRIDQIKHRVPV